MKNWKTLCAKVYMFKWKIIFFEESNFICNFLFSHKPNIPLKKTFNEEFATSLSQKPSHNELFLVDTCVVKMVIPNTPSGHGAVSYSSSKMLPSPGHHIFIAERKKRCVEETKEARAWNSTGIFQELGILLPSVRISCIRQICQCDEMLMKFCFPRGVSAPSLLTAFLSLLVSRTNASNCTIFSCGAVTNNAKLSLI